MEPVQILAQALVDIKRVFEITQGYDAAFRRKCRIILESPELNNALARARDAPAETQEAATPPKPARKRTAKPKPSPEND